ncbi:MAG: transketolase [Pseudomonadales bacterium]|jgi:transketolase
MPSRFERANAIRVLAMDAVEKANSGHPGAPMGLADIAEVLWRDVLRYNPANPNWWNRDRFVLSNGHGSMLLYAVLHLTGYDVSIDDIKAFRQLGSVTAGHPERGECPGVETTTGPLGQGFANAVGMALAELMLARHYNRDGFEVVDHRTWVIVGDGCLMEGISHEVASLAGTLGLGKLVAIYDNNGISIDGDTAGWFTEDVPARFEAYGWRVIRDVDGHDPDTVIAACKSATDSNSAPTLICCRTTIGFGAPGKSGSAAAHGSPLGGDEVRGVRRRLQWEYEPFEIPDHLYREWNMRDSGNSFEETWNMLFARYRKEHPSLADELSRRMEGHLPEGWSLILDKLAKANQKDPKALETRKASKLCLDAMGPHLPELVGGSADLTGSNNTQWDGAGWFADGGRYLNYGVREFGMSAIANGIALHGGFIPFTGTFLVFMEYARNAVRLASLMRLRNIFVYTHDSVGLGEDGPTHQPVEQLSNLRMTPNLSVWRPCDTVETCVAWKQALARVEGPTALILTRQKTSAQIRDESTVNAIECGGYILRRESKSLDVILIATGSEVGIAMEAAGVLEGDDLGCRVVSMPSVDHFLRQSTSYQAQVLPPEHRARVAVEAAHPDYWYRFVGFDGRIVGIDRFGVSAPGDVAMDALGINAEAVVGAARETIG